MVDAWKVEGISYKRKVLFTEPDDQHQTKTLFGCILIAQSEFNPESHHAILAIEDSKTRAKVALQMPNETKYGIIIHPNCIFADWVNKGPGAAISAECILTCDIKISMHFQLNYNTTIGHEFEGGDFFSSA